MSEREMLGLLGKAEEDLTKTLMMQANVVEVAQRGLAFCQQASQMIAQAEREMAGVAQMAVNTSRAEAIIGSIRGAQDATADNVNRLSALRSSVESAIRSARQALKQVQDYKDALHRSGSV